MYGFMAIVVMLFLASMCVIKRVRVPFLLRRSHRASLTLSRAGLCSARRRSGSRRSTRSAAGVASSNPGARESATTHGAARAHTATPGLPLPRFSVSSHSIVSLSLSDPDLVPPVARCRKGGRAQPSRVVWSNYPLQVARPPTSRRFRPSAVLFSPPLFLDVCSTAAHSYTVFTDAHPRTSAPPPPRYALRTPGAPSTSFMYVLYLPAGRCAHGCGTLCESLDVLVTLATLPCGQWENKGD